MHQCPSAFFMEDEQQTIVEELMALLPGNRSTNLDVVKKVLLPETLIKMYQDIKNLSFNQAEDDLLYGDISEPEVSAEEVFMKKMCNIFLTHIHLLKEFSDCLEEKS